MTTDPPPPDLDRAREVARRLFPSLWPDQDAPDAIEVDASNVVFDLNALYRDARRRGSGPDDDAASPE